MQGVLRYKLLIIGIIFVIASAFLLMHANSKQAKCDSLGGKIVQLLNETKQESCAQVKTMQVFSYAGMAMGIALIAVQFVRKK